MLEFISRKIVLAMALIATSLTQIWATEVYDINPSLHHINQVVHQKLPL
ncbi:MAG: hypothetical protein ACRYGR_09085 [Janthinobacterium lividum]